LRFLEINNAYFQTQTDCRFTLSLHITDHSELSSFKGAVDFKAESAAFESVFDLVEGFSNGLLKDPGTRVFVGIESSSSKVYRKGEKLKRKVKRMNKSLKKKEPNSIERIVSVVKDIK
jgi:hypothetical protein